MIIQYNKSYYFLLFSIFILSNFFFHSSTIINDIISYIILTHLTFLILPNIQQMNLNNSNPLLSRRENKGKENLRKKMNSFSFVWLSKKIGKKKECEEKSYGPHQKNFRSKLDGEFFHSLSKNSMHA